MKKIVSILAVVGIIVFFSSCTDTSLEQIEHNEQQEIQFIDKEEVESPDDRDNG